MQAVWRATKQGYFDVLEKYQLILQAGKKETFDRGANPYQNAALLIQLRNYVVHFKPEGVDSNDSLTITKRLDGRFRPNAARKSPRGSWSDHDIFGAGCAEWCWRSARSLTDEFARRLALTLDYQNPRPKDPLPV
ncbi:hypothetical protein ABJI51_17285 [Amycolatopsis sp. NEAU-NG30]|uniref:Uncharacterized protein n=1 Tax=Amycolatopsis melonis TaxID=3156488 RepID=A0ABV0LH97_9PSEU